MAVAAGILDSCGGLRIVVTDLELLHHHISPGERAIVVSDLIVHEPLAWGAIQSLIARVELVVNKWADSEKPNDPEALECWTMYRLRRLEHHHRKSSVNLGDIVET